MPGAGSCDTTQGKLAACGTCARVKRDADRPAPTTRSISETSFARSYSHSCSRGGFDAHLPSGRPGTSLVGLEGRISGIAGIECAFKELRRPGPGHALPRPSAGAPCKGIDARAADMLFLAAHPHKCDHAAMEKTHRRVDGGVSR